MLEIMLLAGSLLGIWHFRKLAMESGEAIEGMASGNLPLAAKAINQVLLQNKVGAMSVRGATLSENAADLVLGKKAQPVREKFVQAWVQYAKPDDFGVLFKLHSPLPVGVGQKDLEKCLDGIATYLGGKVELVKDGNGYGFYLRTRGLEEKIPYETFKFPGGKLMAAIGEGYGGPVAIDLATRPHVLIGADSGAGKSTLQKAILCQMVENLSADELAIYILDLKKLEWVEWQAVDQVAGVVSTVADGLAVAKSIRAEVEARYEKMTGIAKDIHGYNQKCPQKKLPYIVVIMDELFDYGGKDAPIWREVGPILSKCRAAGIHFILGTQRPTTDVIAGDVKANLGVRIGLRTTSHQESLNIIEAGGLEDIPPHQKGRGMVRNGGLEDFQAYWFPEEKMSEILEAHSTGREKYRLPVAVEEAKKGKLGHKN